MILVTGAAGFIGSVFVGYLNELGLEDLVLVDDFSTPEKVANLEGRAFRQNVERARLPAYLRQLDTPPTVVFHLGAHTDTTDPDEDLFETHNLLPSKQLWSYCSDHRVAFIYASSAATYGSGEHGYVDGHDTVPLLKPLNAYGRSKHAFDKWALTQETSPPFWAGLKFFNVYGPNESHKGRMASVVYHAFRQIQLDGKLRLFRSHRDGIDDGMQARDFIYVRDLCEVMVWLSEHRPSSGLYNLGTGTARTFYDLAAAVFTALDKPIDIEYIDTPADIRDSYQYFTQAEMGKLRRSGYVQPFTSLEDGVLEYVTEHLLARHQITQ